MLGAWMALWVGLSAPTGPFTQPVSEIAAASRWVCGRGEAAIECRTAQGDRGLRLPGRFAALAVGRGVCGQTAKGQVRCAALPPKAGRPAAPAPTPPDQPLKGLFAHPRYACGLDAAGAPRCFGEVMRGMAPFPEAEQAQTVHGHADTGCARVAGRLRCWPYPLPDPSVDWAHVIPGVTEVCGLTAAGTIACQDTAWRHPDYGRRRPPPVGPFVEIQGDPQQYACARTAAGRVRCFGTGAEYAGALPAPEAALSSYTVHATVACGVRAADQGVVCWGSGHGDTFAALRTPPAGAFNRVAVSDAQACGVTPAGRVVCWGPGARPAHTAALGDGPVDGLALTTSGVCVLRAGSVACHNVAGAPSGDDFTQLDSTASVVCAARRQGPPACWGEAYDLEHDHFLPPPAEARRVFVEGHAGLALGHDSRLRFWTGPRRVGPPAVAFERLALGDESACGITADGRLGCWGWLSGVSQRRGARAAAVGSSSACAAFADGVRCWQGPLSTLPEAPTLKGAAQAVWRDGDGALAWMADGTVKASDPKAHTPEGAFTAVVAAQGVARLYCGLRPDDTPHCWSTVHGPVQVGLAGRYRQLTLTRYALCGLKPDGGVECAGKPE